jgi:enoyl-CoA hydratase
MRDAPTDWTTLRVEERDDGVVIVRLGRPEARNALNVALMRELTEVARLYRTKPSVRAVVLAGEAEFFSAGADLSPAGARAGQSELSLLELREAVMIGPDLCKAWEEIEAVTIAAVDGYCVGGACALVLACDFRVMGEGAKLRLPEVPLGMNMSWRTLPRLTSLVGPARAKRFTIYGEFADARTCEAWGLADEVAPAGSALDAALAWAAKTAALPPLPVRMSKEAINAAAGALHHATTFMDRDQYLLTFGTQDLKEGIAAFFEKRPGRFTGG